MAARSGVLLLLRHPTSTGTTLAALRPTSYSINNEHIDVTTKDSSLQWRELLPAAGIHSVSITAGGIYSTESTGTLQSLALNRTSTGFWIGDGSTQFNLQALFMVSAYTIEGGHDDAQTFSVTLESNGVVNTTAATT